MYIEIDDGNKVRLVNVQKISHIEIDENYLQINISMSNAEEIVYTFSNKTKLTDFYIALKNTIGESEDLLTLDQDKIIDSYSQIIE